MSRLLCVIACLTTAAVLSGCQCFSASEKYGDLIDEASDHSFCLDRYYKPTWDLTRIGRPDWCQSPINRAWCSLGCRGECRQCSNECTTECPSCAEGWVSQ